MAADLTPTDYAFLILLNIEDREIDNKELASKYGVRLLKDDLDRLKEGFVSTDTKRRPYRHTLTPAGKDELRAQLMVVVDDDNKGGGSKEQRLWAALTALHNQHRLRPTSMPAGLGDRIRVAYADLAAEPGAWVRLKRLRAKLGDVPTADLDRALRQLLHDSDVDLEPEPNQKTLDDDDRRAAVRVGGEDRHILAIGMR